MNEKRIADLAELILGFLLTYSTGCHQATQLNEGAAQVREDYDDLVRNLLDEGRFHEALRRLPQAEAQWSEEMQRAGHSFEGASAYLYSSVMFTIAAAGDSDWGKILDDPDIRYDYKTDLLFEILEERLGKGAVYAGNDENYVVPASGPIDLDTESLRLVEPAK